MSTTTRDRGDRYGPIEWAQSSQEVQRVADNDLALYLVRTSVEYRACAHAALWLAARTRYYLSVTLALAQCHSAWSVCLPAMRIPDVAPRSPVADPPAYSYFLLCAADIIEFYTSASCSSEL